MNTFRRNHHLPVAMQNRSLNLNRFNNAITLSTEKQPIKYRKELQEKYVYEDPDSFDTSFKRNHQFSDGVQSTELNVHHTSSKEDSQPVVLPNKLADDVYQDIDTVLSGNYKSFLFSLINKVSSLFYAKLQVFKRDSRTC